MNFSEQLVELIPRQAFILNLSQIRDSGDWVQVVSHRPGIYAWFRSYNYDKLDRHEFEEQLLRDIFSKKYADREGELKPLHKITLTSAPRLNKKEKIQQALDNSKFRSSLAQALSISVLFQAPLYVGKAVDLNARLDDHINGRSPLKERFAEANILMESCSLMYIYTDLDNDTGVVVSQRTVNDDSPLDSLDIELIYEEIFSRLFSPLFTIRYA